MNQKQSRFTKWSLIIGIVIVLNLFFNYSASLLFNEPQYDAFCTQNQINVAPETQDACVQVGGQWNAYTTPVVEKMPNGQTKTIAGYCDPQFTCRQNFETAQKTYDRNVFVTLVVLGVLCIVLSMILKGNDTLGTALSFGGVLSLVIASMRYWSYADNVLKVAILGLALILLIVIAMKKFNDTNETVRS